MGFYSSGPYCFEISLKILDCYPYKQSTSQSRKNTCDSCSSGQFIISPHMHYTIDRWSFLMLKSPSPSLSSLQTSFFPTFHSLVHPPCGAAFVTELLWHRVPPLPALVSPYATQNWKIITVLPFFLIVSLDRVKLIKKSFYYTSFSWYLPLCQ